MGGGGKLAPAAVMVSMAVLMAAVTTTCQAGAVGPYYHGPAASCGLKVGYYRDRCPHAEDIVRGVVGAAVLRDPGVGAGLVRMLFHDCFVEGCDASVLLDPTPANPQPEKLGPPNNPSLRGYEVIDAAKAAVEAACPGVVSCADIVAFAARDASFFLSHTRVAFQMPAGRLDGRYSNASRTLDFLPPPTFNLGQLVANFAVKGLSVEDMVVLSGAHTVGSSHCSSFVPDRLAVPSDMEPYLAAMLRTQCPAKPSSSNDPTVVQDVVTPNALDNQYYKNVLAHRVLFTSDAALLTSPATAKMVVDNANIPGWWEDRFKAAMVKMASIEVKTGNNGEIRRNCRAVNH
ncbi:peroxidase 2-like [Oryza brachyantha]|uniref:peroxidase 2-like n=1 Tax=Oryza brachyantha TaxID=4533 RepID=UPI001ADC6A7C|nr:peroxidase 2-like [Oryza brachyantha]